MGNKYIRKGTYSVDEILPELTSRYSRRRRKFDGYTVWTGSDRYQCFKEKGVKCVWCGLNGEYFALERHPDINKEMYHFNLYGLNKRGEDILITKDHIVPVSKGGKNHISNYQTMCIRCNVRKGNNYDTRDDDGAR